MNTFLAKIIGIIILVLVVFAGAYVVRERQGGEAQELDVDFSVPQTVRAGEKVLYRVAYTNNTPRLLLDVQATITYPSGSMVLNPDSQKLEAVSSHTERVEKLEGSGRGETIFEAFIFGVAGEKKEAEVLVEFRTEGSNATLRVRKTKEIEIGSLPLAVEFTFPSKINLGEEFELSLNYISTSPSPFPDMGVRMAYPETFRFLASSPSPTSGTGTWDLGSFEANESGEIKIRGVFTGEAGGERIFRAELGTSRPEDFTPYVVRERPVGVSLPGFELIQTIAGVKGGAAMPGAKLNWKVGYKNVSAEILEDVEISVFLESEALDYSSLAGESGTFLRNDKLIRWNKDGLPDLFLLEPGEEGVLEFSSTLKTTPPLEDFDDKNFTVRSRAVAKVKGATLAEDIREFKVNSRFEFYQRGFRASGPFENSGPLPPRVGEKTTYTLSWQLFNSSNDLSDVVVRGALPSGASWEGVVMPSGEQIAFNQNTGEIVWSIEDLRHAVGILLPIRQVSFQVGVIPRTQDVGRTLELIGGSNATAKDAFTGSTLESFSGLVDTTLPDDLSVSENDGIVR